LLSAYEGEFSCDKLIYKLNAKRNKTFFFFKCIGSRDSVLAFSTQVRGFKPGQSRQIFKGEKIPSTPSFRGAVKPLVPCCRFAACKRSLNGVEIVISAKLRDKILAHSSTFYHWDLSRHGGRGGTWWRKWEHLNTGESNGKLPLRTCPGCSVPEPYQLPD